MIAHQVGALYQKTEEGEGLFCMEGKINTNSSISTFTFSQWSYIIASHLPYVNHFSAGPQPEPSYFSPLIQRTPLTDDCKMWDTVLLLNGALAVRAEIKNSILGPFYSADVSRNKACTQWGGQIAAEKNCSRGRKKCLSLRKANAGKLPWKKEGWTGRLRGLRVPPAIPWVIGRGWRRLEPFFWNPIYHGFHLLILNFKDRSLERHPFFGFYY